MLFPGNYQDHPERPDVLIFYYRNREFCDCFCGLLKEDNIYFEAYPPLEDDPRWCVAVYRKNKARAIQLHEETLGRLKKPFIPDPGLRSFVIILFLLIMGLVLAGIIMSDA